MRTMTANVEAHRPTPRHNTAAHAAAENEKANKEARREAAIMKAIVAKGNIQMCAPEALRRSLLTFQLRREATELTEGELLIVAISKETGEIRKYTTRYAENIKFIGNSDYILHGKEGTIYLTYRRTGTAATSWSLQDKRETGI